MIVRYSDLPLSKADLDKDPIQQFGLWFQQAKDNQEPDPSAMALATVDRDYEVTTRMVLLKGFDHRGFIFYTNYESPKAKALREISKASMVFWWPTCQRQVRINGDVTLLSEQESDAYFNTRSREKRIAAIASKQSEPIANREALIERVQEIEEQYQQYQLIPRPSFWGGYLLTPSVIEFWQGREHRLHDRFQFRKIDEKWQLLQLAP